MVTLHSHNDVIGFVLFFSFLELVLVLLSRVRNRVKTGTCVASICVLGAVSSGCNIAALTAAPLFSLGDSFFLCPKA